MKKNLFKCALVLLTVSVLISGCSNKAGTEGSNAQSTASKEKSSDNKSPASPVSAYSIATVRWTDTWPVEFLSSGVMKEIEDKHNIDIDWQIYYNSDWAEQKSLLLASGDLPDAFLGSITLKSSDVSQNKSFFIDLTDKIEPNMPNLMKAFQTAPELKAIATDRDGKIYSLPKKLPKRPEVCGNVLYINTDWLNNLNLDIPTTYKELEDVLEAFVTQDADGDGDPGNEIGITNAAGSLVLDGDLRNYMFPFGTMVSRANNYMGLNGDGVPVFMPIEDNYREAVKWMRGMYEKGILDPEYFTQEGSMATAKRQAEGGSRVGLISGWTADAEAGVNVDQFTVLESVAGPDGNRYVENAANFLDISDRELLITTKCADPDKLLQWADDFYTDLVSLQTFYGSIPDCISENSDGTYTVDVPTDGSSLDTSAWSNSLRDYGPKYMNIDFYDKISLPDNQGDGIKLKEDEVNGKHVTQDRNVGLPMLQYTEEELARTTTLGTDIYKYCEAQYARWVVYGGADEEWDDYIKQLEAMGVRELVEIHNKAYDSYKESMK